MGSFLLEKHTKKLAKEIFAYIQKQNITNLAPQLIKKTMFKLGSFNEDLKNQVFSFVDLLPAIKDGAEARKYLFEYLEQATILGKVVNKSLPNLAEPLLKEFIDFSVDKVARNFIAASNIDELRNRLLGFEGLNTYSIDILGEAAVNEDEAQAYLEQYLDLINKFAGSNISVKLSSIFSKIKPVAHEQSKEKLKDRLTKIYKAAIKQNCFINVDFEYAEWHELCLEVVTELLNEDEFRDWDQAGLVLQAYLKESPSSFEKLLDWAKCRGTPITIRLVKGAYWDYEVAHAQQQGWDIPVFTDKNECDANFEYLTQRIINNHKYLRPAIASHNIRSIAAAIAYAKSQKLDQSEIEFQVLYGMIDPLKHYLIDAGFRTRTYMPYGELVPGMAYLVRRLLENSANESFLKQSFIENKDLDELIKKPKKKVLDELKSLIDKKFEDKSEDFINASNSDFSKARNREAQIKAISFCKPRFEAKSLVENTEVDLEETITKANDAHKLWSKVDYKLRSEVLKNIAKRLEENRFKLNALLVLEVGKSWIEADTETSEAIDFMNYYAICNQKLNENYQLLSMPGELNQNHYKSRGVAGVIGPWNFPLAILAGMSMAALVTGNTVVIKPSEEASLIGYEFTKLAQKVLEEVLAKHKISKIPNCINFIHGDGEKLGRHLVTHPSIQIISFTGSEKVGMEINQRAREKDTPCRVIAEMGGKNAIIIDNTADLDHAIPGVLASAFNFAGQKCSACSRLIITESIYDQAISRLVKAAEDLKQGSAEDSSNDYGRVISTESANKCWDFIYQAKDEHKLLFSAPNLGELYIPAHIFEVDSPRAKLFQEEVFGPVLATLKVKDLDEAIQVANDNRYGLTAAIYSRSPHNIQQFTDEMQAGNLYINRGSTGAVVGRQSFGGLKNSSIGFKAGGPQYLLEFMKEQTITTNTMRQGFLTQ